MIHGWMVSAKDSALRMMRDYMSFSPNVKLSCVELDRMFCILILHAT